MVDSSANCIAEYLDGWAKTGSSGSSSCLILVVAIEEMGQQLGQRWLRGSVGSDGVG